MKKIVRGNDFTMRIPVVKIVDGEKVAFPLPGCTDIVVRLCSAYRRLELAYTIDAKEDNVIVARVEGDKIPLGTYALEVRGKIFGNDWRSNEYEQVAIVDRNADGDTELGETDEGENSVEMDTAVVVLPPDRELDALVKEAQAQNKAVSELSDTIKASEEGRTKSEESRASNEEGRVQAELTRVSNEAERVQAEQARVNSEGQRLTAEQGRASAESARADAETARANAETARAKSENARTEAEATRLEAEKTRTTAEDTRTRTEEEREANELTRKTNEQARQANEGARQAAEQKREGDTATAIATMKSDASAAVKTVQDATNTAIASMDEHRAAFDDAEAARVSNEQGRQADEAARKEAESEREAQEQARVEAEERREENCAAAVDAAKTAATGAENCDITMQGSTITVTDRDGRQKSVDVVDTDEVVTLTVAAAVDSINVSGIKVNVYFNHDTKSPLQLTTNAEGMTTFTAKRGEYYEVKLPEYGGAQPIAPIGFTATLPGREISVTYMPYDKDSSEEVAVTVARYPDGKYTAWANKEVKCTYDGNTSSFFTDSKGKVTIYVPLNKTYTITVDDEDGYTAYMKKNHVTYTAELSYREVSFDFYQYRTGLFCLTGDGKAYSIDEFMATGKDSSEVVAFKWASYELITHKGTFAFRTSDLRNMADLTTAKWSSESVNFPSIPGSGYQQTVAYFYNGQDATTLIRQDAITLNVTANAADAAYGQTITIGGETLHGFLPSGGQINIFIDNMTLLRDIMTKLYGKDVSDDFFVNFKPCWSSIQHADVNGLYYTNKTTNFASKGNLLGVLPAFSL